MNKNAARIMTNKFTNETFYFTIYKKVKKTENS